MYLIDGLSDKPKQTQTIILPNGERATLYLEYKALQLGWFMSLTYGDFVWTNVRIVNSPNIIRQAKNIVPFGVSCRVEDDQEPTLKTDFSTGRAKLYLLDEAEMEEFEEYLGS